MIKLFPAFLGLFASFQLINSPVFAKSKTYSNGVTVACGPTGKWQTSGVNRSEDGYIVIYDWETESELAAYPLYYHISANALTHEQKETLDSKLNSYTGKNPVLCFTGVLSERSNWYSGYSPALFDSPFHQRIMAQHFGVIHRVSTKH